MIYGFLTCNVFHRLIGKRNVLFFFFTIHLGIEITPETKKVPFEKARTDEQSI